MQADGKAEADGEEEPKADNTKKGSATADGKEESPAANGKDVEMIDAEEQVTLICGLCPLLEVAATTHGSLTASLTMSGCLPWH